MATLLLEFVLSDLLVKDVIEEFVEILLCQLVVELSSMGLNNVASPGGRAVCQGIIL